MLRKLKQSEILLASVFSILLKILSALSGFLLTFFVIKILDITEAGYFLTALSIIMVVSAICRVGLDNIVLRHTGESHTDINSSYRETVTISLVIAAITGLAVFFISFFLKQHITTLFFGGLASTSIVVILCICILVFGLNTIIGIAFQGKKWIALSIFMLTLGANSVFIISLVLFPSATTTDTLLLYMIALVLCSIVGAILWQFKFGFSLKNLEFNRIKSSAFPLTIILVVGQIFHWGPQIAVSLYVSASEVAQYTATHRTALLISFILNAVNMIVAPRFADRYRNNDYAGLEKIAKQAVMLMIALVLPIYIFVMLAPNIVMSIFGEAFQNQGNSLRVLATAQLFNVFSGSVAFLLTMTGHEKDLRNSMLFTGFLFVFGLITLVPTFGVNGAIVTTAVVLIIQNIINIIYVRKRLGFNTLTFWKFTLDSKNA